MPAQRIRSSVRRSSPSSKGKNLDRSFRDQLMKVIYERTATCPSCRYSLNGMVGTRCPECGLVVEEYLRVADTMPNSWRELRRQQTRWNRIIFSGAVLVMAAAIIVCASIFIQ
ncbi:MAG: hypothetical protein H7210_05005 [Pyrinomonadaceae bacterium]|nr:hypothetical protein [Phycisphaerales bacterium]